MATPVKCEAMEKKTSPVDHIAPPKSPSKCPRAGPWKNPLKATGSPTSGCFIKYVFQRGQESSAPSVRKTHTLYSPRAFPCVSARVENGAQVPISTPETTLTMRPLRETVFPDATCS